MKVSREQAEQAQEALGRELNDPWWLRGIGIMRDEHGSYFLKVDVQSVVDNKIMVPVRLKDMLGRLRDDVPIKVVVRA